MFRGWQGAEEQQRLKEETVEIEEYCGIRVLNPLTRGAKVLESALTRESKETRSQDTMFTFKPTIDHFVFRAQTHFRVNTRLLAKSSTSHASIFPRVIDV